MEAAQEASAGERSAKVSRDNFGTINIGTNIATQGGAVVSGSVNAGGHFIGRDMIQYVTQIVQRGEDVEEAKSVIALYLHALASDLAGLKLGRIDASTDQRRREPLQLADVYVPLDITQHIPKNMTLAEWLSRERSARRHDPHEQRETRPVSALEALAAHRELTVLGKPGSGKSTFGASVLLALAQTWQGHDEELAKLGETWTHGPSLPIRVILRHFAEQLPPGDKNASAHDLWAFIDKEFHQSGYGLSAGVMKYVARIAPPVGQKLAEARLRLFLSV